MQSLLAAVPSIWVIPAHNYMGVSLGKVSGVLSQVLDAMLHRIDRYKHFPRTVDTCINTKNSFSAVAGILKTLEAKDPLKWGACL